MKIACLGWGSLIWRPENLLIRRQWFSDGPFLPIEYTRQSENGRMTLVITPGVKPLRTLWALMATEKLDTAKESLRIREGIGKRSANEKIASITVSEETNDETKLIIKNWATSLKLDAVIWTNLKPKFNEEERAPTLAEIISYLHSIDVNKKALAEEYIRRTPKQIDTDFRRELEKEFNWSLIE